LAASPGSMVMARLRSDGRSGDSCKVLCITEFFESRPPKTRLRCSKDERAENFSVIPGAAEGPEPGIDLTGSVAQQWIPDSRFAASGMTPTELDRTLRRGILARNGRRVAAVRVAHDLAVRER